MWEQKIVCFALMTGGWMQGSDEHNIVGAESLSDMVDEEEDEVDGKKSGRMKKRGRRGSSTAREI